MNFSYLKNYPDLTALYNYCTEAEAFAVSNPDISITAARKAIEYMVKLLYGAKICPEIRGMTMFDMLSDYDFTDYLNSRTLTDAIHFIRKKGNQAVHEGNMSQQDTMQVLEKLHYVTGEICIKLGVISSYPAFDPNLKPEKAVSRSAAASTDEPFVDEALIRRLSQLMRNRMKSAAYAKSKEDIVDVHVSPAMDTKGKREQRIMAGTDSGANGKTAYQHLAKYMTDMLPEIQVLMESVKSQLILIREGKETVVVVKTGCTNLGSKDYAGNWQLLPDVDYVLYAPEVTGDHPVQEQFRVFTKDEFIRFWEDLGLLRFKVSTAMRKRIASTLAPGEKIAAEKHADVISVQSFTNSGRKYPLVIKKLEAYPLLTETDMHTLL